MDHALHMPWTLGEGDWGGLIWMLILVVFWVIGAISKSAQEKKAQKPQRPQSGGSAPPSAGDRARTVRQRLNELAEQRRRQLQEIAQQKQTEHERRERPLAPPLNTTTATPTASREASTDVSRRRQEAERRAEALQREQNERRVMEQRRAAEQARRQQMAAQHEAAERQRRLQQQAAQPERQRMAVDSTQPGHLEGEVHRHVADAPPPPQKIPIHPSLITTRQGLRQAIIMKEVLDKPLALRDTEVLPYEW